MTCPIFTATSPVWIRRMNRENRQAAVGPGAAADFFFGVTSLRDTADGSIDQGVVTGIFGDAQFRIVFVAAGLGQTTLQIGSFSEYLGIYVEDPGDQQIFNTSVDLFVVPEPGTALLLGLGLVGLAARRSRLGADPH
jgi:hypothetical protein